MKLANNHWCSTLEWDTTHPGSLILEKPEDYREIVGDLSAQSNGGEGILVFSDQGNLFSLGKEGILVRDLWSVDVNQKKLLAGVCRSLTQLVQEEHYQELFSLLQQCETILSALQQESMLPLEWETPVDISPIFKALGVHLEAADDPFERLVDYIRLCQEFLHSRFAVLVGLRSYLTDREWTALCYDFSACGIPVLFVDPAAGALQENEKRLVIDIDRCELILS